MPETIRRCTPADAEAIAALIGKLSHYFVADVAAASVQPFLATFHPPAIAELLAKPEFVCLAIEETGYLLGVITLHRPAHLHHLFVSPDAHRRGIARSLWRAIQAELPMPATVTVNSSEFAVPVYQSFGFVATAEVQERSGVRYIPMRRAPDLVGATK